MMHRRSRGKRGAAILLVAAALFGQSSPAAAEQNPYTQIQDGNVAIQVVNGPYYVVKNTQATYQYKVSNISGHKLRFVDVMDDSTCPQAIGEMGLFKPTHEFTCSVFVGSSKTIFEKVQWKRYKGSSTTYLDHVLNVNVIDPKVEIELLDIGTNGGTWYTGLNQPMTAKVTNTGTTPLKQVSAKLQNLNQECNFTEFTLAVGESALRTCTMNVNPGEGTTSRQVSAQVRARPNVGHSYSPENFEATDSATRTYPVTEAQAGIEITTGSTRNDLGWFLGDVLVDMPVKLENTGNLPADLSAVSSNAPNCAGPARFFPNVPPGGIRTYTCQVNIASPGNLQIEGKAQLTIGTAHPSWKDQHSTTFPVWVNPLQLEIFPISSSNSTVLKVTNLGESNVNLYGSNITAHHGCTNAFPISTNVGANGGTATFICQLAGPTSYSDLGYEILGYFRGYPFRARQGYNPEAGSAASTTLGG